MKPPENARAARQGGPHADDLKAAHSHGEEGGARTLCPMPARPTRGPQIFCDSDNASVEAFAVQVGCRDLMVDCVRRESGKRCRPHATATAVRRNGYVFLLLFFGGFPNEADNGWQSLAAADSPEAARFLEDLAMRAFKTRPEFIVRPNGWEARP